MPVPSLPTPAFELLRPGKGPHQRVSVTAGGPAPCLPAAPSPWYPSVSASVRRFCFSPSSSVLAVSLAQLRVAAPPQRHTLVVSPLTAGLAWGQPPMWNFRPQRCSPVDVFWCSCPVCMGLPPPGMLCPDSGLLSSYAAQEIPTAKGE